jgi:hypothetical protein
MIQGRSYGLRGPAVLGPRPRDGRRTGAGRPAGARHARTDFTATLARKNQTLRLEVFDRDTRPPSLLGLDAESTSGRGLHIVSGLADEWGWRTAEDDDGVSGKVV